MGTLHSLSAHSNGVLSALAANKVLGVITRCYLRSKKRSQLAEMLDFSDSMLSDIGLTRYYLIQESKKFFWEA